MADGRACYAGVRSSLRLEPALLPKALDLPLQQVPDEDARNRSRSASMEEVVVSVCDNLRDLTKQFGPKERRTSQKSARCSYQSVCEEGWFLRKGDFVSMYDDKTENEATHGIRLFLLCLPEDEMD